MSDKGLLHAAMIVGAAIVASSGSVPAVVSWSVYVTIMLVLVK